MGWWDALVETAGDIGEAAIDTTKRGAKYLENSGLGTTFKEGVNTVSEGGKELMHQGEALMNEGEKLFDKGKDYFFMDKTAKEYASTLNTKGAGDWKMVGTGKKLEGKDLEAIQKRMAEAGVAAPTEDSVAADMMRNYFEQANDKKFRRMLAGAAVGAGLGYLKDKEQRKNRKGMGGLGQTAAGRALASAAPGNKLGTGFNPYKGSVFSGGK